MRHIVTIVAILALITAGLALAGAKPTVDHGCQSVQGQTHCPGDTEHPCQPMQGRSHGLNGVELAP